MPTAQKRSAPFAQMAWRYFAEVSGFFYVPLIVVLADHCRSFVADFVALDRPAVHASFWGVERRYTVGGVWVEVISENDLIV